MPPTPDPAPLLRPLEEEIRALQEEVRALRAAREVAVGQASDTARYHQGQARFRAVFEHSPLGHKIIGPDLAIRQANAATAALLGVAAPRDLVGRRISEFAHPAHRADWAALQTALWDHHLPAFALETRLRRADGADLWCRVTSVLFPDAGGELGFTTLEDITAREHLAAALRTTAQQQEGANRQLRRLNDELSAVNEELSVLNEELHEANVGLSQANAELDTFVYAASHDLRTPVTNLEGLLQALAEQLPAEALRDAPAAALWGMVDTSVARFRHTLDRLADFGAARNVAAAAREDVALAAAFEAVRAEVASGLAATGGRLEVDVAGDPRLRFSPAHLHSVLLNLVTNALKYRHPDRAPLVRMQAYREATRVVVSVQDNGRGLSEAQQGQLFRLFKRFHPDVAGTGVGLYLVKKILDHARATIQVESQPDRGTTFTLVFPR